MNLPMVTSGALNATTGNTSLPSAVTLASQSPNIAVRWAGLN